MNTLNEKRTVEISTGIIFRTVLILLGMYFLYLISDVIAIFFVALIFTAAVGPLVSWLAVKKIPRSISVLTIYLILFCIIGSLIAVIIPEIASQFRDFSENTPLYTEKITKTFSGIQNFVDSHGSFFNINDVAKNIVSGIPKSSSQIFSTTADVLSGLVSIIVVLSLTFYLSVKEDGMRTFLELVVPHGHQSYAISLAERMEEKIGKWMQGQFFLMLTIFVFDFLALYFLNVPYALVIALIGGVTEIIPYLGPILGAIPAVVMGFLVSPTTGLLVLLLYIIIQQIENHVIVPQVMRKAVGLNPIAVILALLVGVKLGGILGAVISVPVVAALSVFVGDLVNSKK
jgi:predicted PurR-regulated permease PerM